MTNRHTKERRVTITESDNKAATRKILIESDQTLNTFGKQGSAITLERGVWETFEGDEVV